MKIKYLILFSFALSIFSCVTDNTVHTFNEVNKIEVENFEEKYEVDYGSEFTIDPTIKFGGDESKLTYVWYKNRQGAMVEFNDTLSTEKVLKIKEELGNVVPGIEHRISLKVTDSETGIFTVVSAELFTVAAYNNGLIVLTKESSGCDLAYVSNKDFVVKDDIFSGANNGEMLSDASTRLLYTNMAKSNQTGTFAIIAAANDPTGGYHLDYNTLTKSATMAEKITGEFGGANIDVTAYGLGKNGKDGLIVNNRFHGRVNPYWQTVGPQNWHPAAPISTNGEKDMQLADCIINIDAYTKDLLVFDEKFGRILYYDHDKAFLYPQEAAPNDINAFNPQDMGADMDVIAASVKDLVPQSAGSWIKMAQSWVLAKQEGKYFLYQFQVGGWSPVLSTTSKVELSAAISANIDKAKEVVPASYLGEAADGFNREIMGARGCFLYVVDNKLYLYDMIENTEKHLVGANPNGENITALYFYTTFVETGSGDNITTTSESRIALGLGDKVVVYKLSSVGGYNVTELTTTGSLGTEVIGIVNKPV